MQEEMKKSTLKTLTAEEKAHQMDQLLAEEEEKLSILEKEISVQREKQVQEEWVCKFVAITESPVQFKKAQELFELKRKMADVQAEIQVLVAPYDYLIVTKLSCVC